MATARQSGARLDYVDSLRVFLIALVVAHHAVEPYASSIARWTILQWAQIGSSLPVGARILVSVFGGVALAFATSRFVVRRIPGARRVFY